MNTANFLIQHTAPSQGLRHGSARLWLNVDVPQPSPETVPLPPSPHPVPPPPALPPEITDPVLPGQNEPVREPYLPPTVPMGNGLH